MSIASRRAFLATAGSFALTAAVDGPARAVIGPNDSAVRGAVRPT